MTLILCLFHFNVDLGVLVCVINYVWFAWICNLMDPIWTWMTGPAVCVEVCEGVLRCTRG